MIINRLADNLRQQNWFTVFIEFLIVVVGIFVGLQVDDWNQLRKDKQEEQQVLKRLVRDLETDQKTINEIQDFYSSHFVTLEAQRDIILKDELTDTDISEVINYSGASIQELNPRTTTYDAIVNSGKLYKLTNEDLVDKIIDYYRLLDDNIYQNRQTRDEFRSLFYGAPLTEKWYWVSHPDKSKYAQIFFSNTHTDAYKVLMQSASWSVFIIRNRIESNTEILEQNKALVETISKHVS